MRLSHGVPLLAVVVVLSLGLFWASQSSEAQSAIPPEEAAAVPLDEASGELSVENDRSVAEVLEDGTVSFVEYEEAIRRVVACDEEQGGFSPETSFSKETGGYTFTFGGTDHVLRIHDRCRSRYLDDIELSYSSQNAPSASERAKQSQQYEACVQDKGYDPDRIAEASLNDKLAYNTYVRCSDLTDSVIID